ncbi:hypothetical protein [Ectobacillus panaciterrae]|uniref:hypothetical protein n=1 Tax=Ectobacillus panaciterrae TaxID=363872 RepID=UPI0004216F61|nr:hypothetical protein [Ectobacillus panaciterrae]
MESIIITYISKRNGEMDIELFNGASAAQVVEELYELDGIEYQWKNEMYDLEYAVDGKSWKKLGRKERLADAGIWDGMYLRLRPGIQPIPNPAEQNPVEQKPFAPSAPVPSVVPEEPKQPDNKEYVWKLLE